METEIVQAKKSKKGSILVWLFLLLIALAVIFLLVRNKKQGDDFGQIQDKGSASIEVETEDGVFSLSQEELEALPVAELDVEDIGLSRMYLTTEEDLGQLRLVAPGANPLTYDERVINYEGQEVRNDAFPMSESAPRQSDLLNKQMLPEYVLQMDISDGKFSPSVFRTKAGSITTFSLTSHDVLAHSLSFDDPQLSGVFMIIGPNQTRAINFKAPLEPGEYSFRCNSYDHPTTEVGTMIVTE